LNRPARQDASSADVVHRSALPALLLGGAAIGCSPIFVRVSEVGPIATAFWRLVLALLPLLLVYYREKSRVHGRHRLQTRREYFDVTAPGLFLAADLAAWHISLHMTSVANSTLLVNVAPIFVTLFSWLALRHRIRGLFLVGLGVAIVGIVVLKGGPAALGGGDIRGDSVAVTAAALYAGYILLLGRARKRYPTTTIMVWSTISAACCTGLLAVLTEPHLLPLTVRSWMILLGLAWISQAGGQSLIAFALAWLPATLSSLTLLIQPVVAALLAWLLLHEPLTTFQIVGGLIVIGGIALARRGS
jgi:drug/metabolite transporter (DMT)-like permease